MKITLIQHPTVALKLLGHSDLDFGLDPDQGLYLGNVYRRVMPASLLRVAGVIRRSVDAKVRILDLRCHTDTTESIDKLVEFGRYKLEVRRVGTDFHHADNAIDNSDWIGLSSHFTFESGVVRDLINYAKSIKPDIKIMVGGADVRARPKEYLKFGADLVFEEDFHPGVFKDVVTGFKALPLIVAKYRHPFSELIYSAFDLLDDISRYTEGHDGKVPVSVSTPVGFAYFTRGCPRDCSYCESRQTTYEPIDLESSINMLEHYKKAGITTLNIQDDNLLIAKDKDLTVLFDAMRKMGFAWEFPNGLELSALARGDPAACVQRNMALFSHSESKDGYIGCYRMYAPLETFDDENTSSTLNRHQLKKLASIELQNEIISALYTAGIPQLNFGVIIPPDATEQTFQNIASGYGTLKRRHELSMQYHHRQGPEVRLGIFHLIPIAMHRMIETLFSVDDFPEGWQFYVPCYNGKHFSADELLRRRLELMKMIDPINYKALARGSYEYG